MSFMNMGKKVIACELVFILLFSSTLAVAQMTIADQGVDKQKITSTLDNIFTKTTDKEQEKEETSKVDINPVPLPVISQKTSSSVSNKKSIKEDTSVPEEKPQSTVSEDIPVTLLASDEPGITIQSLVNIDDLAVTKTTVNGITYQQISLPGYASTTDIGKPQLPLKTQLVAIPETGDINLKILSSTYKTLHGYTVYPAQKPVELTSSDGSLYNEKAFSLDKKSYSTNTFYPTNTPVKIESISFLREQRLARIGFYPIQYNPVTKEIRVYTMIKVAVQDSGGDASVDIKSVGPFDSICSDLVLNYDDALASSPHGTKNLETRQGSVTFPAVLDDPNNKADYLIITSDDFYSNSQLRDLANWRASYNGFDVAIVSVNQPIIGGNTDTKIKTFIRYVYENWSAPHMSDNHVGYILLVGDIQFVATHIFETTAIDRWYVCIGDEDYSTQDIMIGRFSVDTFWDLNTIARKTINYEKYYNDEDWHKQVLMGRGSYYEVARFFPWYDDTKNILLGFGGWSVSEAFIEQLGPEAACTTLINGINEGRGIVVYCGHGDIDIWEIFNIHHDPPNYDYTQLHNGDKLPLVFSLACLTGSFQASSDCMGELLLNTPHKGAVAFFGASQETGPSTFYFAKYLFSSMFEHSEYIVGKIIAEALMQTPALIPMSSYREYNLLGDPALDLSNSTGHPEKPDLTISHLNISATLENPTSTIVTLGAIVHNIGGSTANNVDVSFLVEEQNGEQHVLYTQTIEEIQPHSQYTITHQTTLNELSKALIVQLDPADTIDEAYELNNQAGINTTSISPMSVEIHGPAERVYTDETIQFTGTVHGGVPPYLWRWDFGDETTETTTVPSVFHVYHEAGNYLVTLTVTDMVGYTADDTMMYALLSPVIYVDDDYTPSTPGWRIDHFNNISAGINAVIDNGMVQVSKGIYYEHIAISKPVKLIGENKKNTIIDGCENGNVVVLSPKDVTVQGFTIRNSGTSSNGIYIKPGSTDVGNILITDNNITQNGNGIFVTGGSNIIIIGNTILGNSGYGIKFAFASGIYRIYHNNFINNNQNALVSIGQNFYFDNEYPSGGNYWSTSYTGSDIYRGEAQNILGSDGIGDTQYTVSLNKVDHYPLMHQFVPGDMNVDGMVNNFDINPFVLALQNPEGYTRQYHMLPVIHGDCNQDGIVNNLDINPLVKLLTGT